MHRRAECWKSAVLTGMRPISKLAGVITLHVGGSVLVVVVQVLHAGSAWVVVAILALILGVYAEGSYRIWADSEEAKEALLEAKDAALLQLEALAKPVAVPERHREGMCKFVAVIRETVLKSQEVGFPSDLWRVALAAHYPELSRTLDQWHSALRRERDAQVSLGAKLADEAETAGIIAPTYQTDLLVRLMLLLLTEHAEEGKLNGAWRVIGWDSHSLPRPDSTKEMRIVLGPEIVATTDFEPGDTAHDRFKAIVGRVDDWFDAAHRWPEMREVAESITARHALWDEVQEAAERATHREELMRSTDCPMCIENQRA